MSVLSAINKRMGNPSQQADAVVSYSFTTPAVTKIDQALRQSGPSDRFELAIDLFRLWFEAGMCRKEERQEEAKEVFGEIFEDYGSQSLMYTVTADGKQLRVWYGRPAVMRPDHVDSCGTNLLFGVYGPPSEVAKYLEALRQIHELDKIEVPNGVQLYMHWGY